MKKKVAKKKTIKEALQIINLKVNSKDRAALTKRAKLYARGNLSALLREAALNYKPKSGKVQLWPIYK